jgi:deoxyadenosine/deoxycytidine kinase
MAFDAYKLHRETSENEYPAVPPLKDKTLFIIRGLPGSGKSTLAELLAAVYHTEHWYEADMYFEGPEGYKFDPRLLADAHDWCLDNAIHAMQDSAHCVIVSNTFTRNTEMDSYLEIAEDLEYHIQVIHCEGKFGSIHGVPQETIDKMYARWEPYAKV